jgi:hypothetical protein
MSSPEPFAALRSQFEAWARNVMDLSLERFTAVDQPRSADPSERLRDYVDPAIELAWTAWYTAALPLMVSQSQLHRRTQAAESKMTQEVKDAAAADRNIRQWYLRRRKYAEERLKLPLLLAKTEHQLWRYRHTVNDVLNKLQRLPPPL